MIDKLDNILLWPGFISVIALWIIGGQWKGRIRDIPVPIILGVILGIQFKDFWLGFWSIGAFQQIKMGYGNYSPEDDPEPSLLARILHDRNGWWIRLIWGLLVGISGGLFLKLFGHISLLKYFLYIGTVAGVSFSVSRFRLPVFITDALVSASVASIIFIKFLPF